MTTNFAVFLYKRKKVCYNESIPEAHASKTLAKEEGRTMKKILTLALLVLAMVFVLASCDKTGTSTPVDVTVNNDGYVVINGVKTEHKVHTKDEITVDDDGYLVVNGNKTEHKAAKEDEITVSNEGYIVVNGVKTDYKIDVADSVKVVNGYLVVNGNKTDYKV
jgi:flagellar basal body rod protein FlgG